MTASQGVIDGSALVGLDRADCLDWLRALPPRSLDLVFGSPPYPDKARRYGDDQVPPLPARQSVPWMPEVTAAALGACRGDVLWVVNAPVIDGRYGPAVEALMVYADARGLRCERPVIWHKNAPPNRKDWYGNDWEYVVCFR